MLHRTISFYDPKIRSQVKILRRNKKFMLGVDRTRNFLFAAKKTTFVWLVLRLRAFWCAWFVRCNMVNRAG